MISIPLDVSFVRKSIRTANYELRFRYNTQGDYFYFDLYSTDGQAVRLHNKVTTGYDFGGFRFTSSDQSSYATADNVSGFRMLEDG